MVNPVTLLGVFAVTGMLVTYALEKRSPWFTLAFAAACLTAAAYGFLQGAWLFALILAIWAGVAARRWFLSRALTGSRAARPALRS